MGRLPGHGGGHQRHAGEDGRPEGLHPGAASHQPHPTYGFLQLRPSGAVVDERIYVPQHPLAWGKKIAVTSSATADASGYAEVFSLNEAACQSGGPNDVGYYADTQGGSSGLPGARLRRPSGGGAAPLLQLSQPGRAHPGDHHPPGHEPPQCALRGDACPDPFGSTARHASAASVLDRVLHLQRHQHLQRPAEHGEQGPRPQRGRRGEVGTCSLTGARPPATRTCACMTPRAPRSPPTMTRAPASRPPSSTPSPWAGAAPSSAPAATPASVAAARWCGSALRPPRPGRLPPGASARPLSCQVQETWGRWLVTGGVCSFIL